MSHPRARKYAQHISYWSHSVSNTYSAVILQNDDHYILLLDGGFGTFRTELDGEAVSVTDLSEHCPLAIDVELQMHRIVLTQTSQIHIQSLSTSLLTFQLAPVLSRFGSTKSLMTPLRSYRSSIMEASGYRETTTRSGLRAGTSTMVIDGPTVLTSYQRKTSRNGGCGEWIWVKKMLVGKMLQKMSLDIQTPSELLQARQLLYQTTTTKSGWGALLCIVIYLNMWCANRPGSLVVYPTQRPLRPPRS